MKKVLISGGSGFVGKNLIPILKKSNELISITRLKINSSEVLWDNLDSYNESFTSFIHLAGKAHDLKNASQAQEYMDVNVGLTKKAFEVFKRCEGETFIYFSSVKAVASSVSGILKENDEYKVDNPYGRSKKAAEDFLNAQELSNNQRIYILRPCMIHGAGNKGNLNLLYKMASKGVPFPFGSYKNERSLLGIDNLNEVILGLLDKRPESGVYNMADDDVISTNRIYQIMGDCLNKKAKTWNIPKLLIASIGRIGDYLPLPIDTLKIQKLTENYRVSNEKIKTALGWDKMPSTLEDNLKKTIKSFQKN